MKYSLLVLLVFIFTVKLYEAGFCRHKGFLSNKPYITRFDVSSKIENRYATTTILTEVWNKEIFKQKIFFYTNIPENAYITSFTMEVHGVIYKAYLEEKEKAERMYRHATWTSNETGFTAVSTRDTQHFKLMIKTPHLSDVTFTLKYEELLERRFNKYRHVINLNLGQVVNTFDVDIIITEATEIKNLFVPEVKISNTIGDETKANPYASIYRLSKKNAVIVFEPTVSQQLDISGRCFHGQLIIEYELDYENPCGQLLADSGYFVHFYGPKRLKPLRKLVIFLLDLSGSMAGRKLEQLTQAMYTILDQLNEEDFFAVVSFNKHVVTHDLGNKPIVTYPAVEKYLDKAKDVISKFVADGETNIDDALQFSITLSHRAIKRIKNSKNIDRLVPLIMFLTDGEPTYKERRIPEILKKVDEKNQPRTAIFSLGFGKMAHLEFLEKLSIRNDGFSKAIYEAPDAALQLQNFYERISSILLTNINFTYSQVLEKSLTQQFFPTFFNGTDIVVSGKMANKNSMSWTVQAVAENGTTICSSEDVQRVTRFNYDNSNETSTLERPWAFKKIKQLLDDIKIADPDDKKKTNELYEEAVKLSLKYNFATPVTSLIMPLPGSQKDEIYDPIKTIVVEEDTQEQYPTTERPFPPYSEVPHDIEWLNLLEDTYDGAGKIVQIPFGNPFNEYVLLKKPVPFKYNACKLVNNIPRTCTHLAYCITDELKTSYLYYLEKFCPIEERYAGICCPDDRITELVDVSLSGLQSLAT
ncbi:hypothetical protein O3M35_001364 [Rhynocoris fuscipes]|uniref:VWFA domain-containing protein n=1 Tax=Rhynocoris fuscipes TaxID=488301 RepID=A0AAW1DUD8_9HEMI